MALPLTLHVWSGAWSLPSVDPASINAACYLQLAFPGRWTLCESNDPDSSPNGQLPYLQHGPHLISSLSSIVVYLAKLSPESASLAPSELTDVKSPTTSKHRVSDLDDDLSDGKRAEGVAWKAVVEGELADLVSYCLFSPTDNYTLIHDHLAKHLSFPQNQYLPNRLRGIHQQRLTAVNLWDTASSSTSSAASNPSDRIGIMNTPKLLTPLQTASKDLPLKFSTQALLNHARPTLSILSSVLASSSTDFLFDSPNPTTTDLALFSHLALILLPPFPSATLPTHIREEYPNLLAHTLRILSLCFPPDSLDAWPTRLEGGTGSGGGVGVLGLVGRAVGAVPEVMRGLWTGQGGTVPKDGMMGEGGKKKLGKEKTKKEKDFERTRRWWFVGTGVTFVVYLFASGLVQVDFANADDEEEEVGEAVDDAEQEEETSTEGAD